MTTTDKDWLLEILDKVFVMGMTTEKVMQKDHGLPDKRKMLTEPYAAIQAHIAEIIGEDSDYAGIDSGNGVADMVEIARLSSLDNLRAEQRKRAGL